MSDTKKDTAAPLAGVALVLATLAVGALWQSTPLVSSRPQGSNTTPPAVELTRVPARLWQDPFDAILKSNEHTSAGGQKDGIASAAALGRAPGTCSGWSCLALIVTVTGGSLPDEAESRRRTRYAVVSALARAGYEPEDGDGLGIATYETGSKRLSTTPFEWYRLGETGSADLPYFTLVLWVDNDRLQRTPLQDLRLILSWVTRTTGMPATQVKLIGPRDSGTLRRIVEEAAEARASRLPALSRLFMYSPWATAERNEILSAVAQANGSRLEDFLNAQNVQLQSIVSDDFAVATALVEELYRRGVRIGDSYDIAVVTEWDSFYGRAFPRTFSRAAWRTNCIADGKSPQSCDRYPAHPQVHLYSYLRGLDGSLPTKSSVSDDAKKPSADRLAVTREELERRRVALERPEGDGQLDYLRRLADRIEAAPRRLQVSEPCGIRERLGQGCRRIGAIGVLGSDVYDKLLVLQALRPRFPDAVFFTTDLDALLLHPAEIQWTRNLIVASSFGLSLNDAWQGEIPPFRDSYQTSVFTATLAALNWLRTSVNQNPHQTGWMRAATYQPRPSSNSLDDDCSVRLFEVGRYGAVDISRDCPGSPHPLRQDIVGSRDIGPFLPLAGLVVPLVAIAAVLAGPMLPYAYFRPEWTRLKAAGLLFGALATAALMLTFAKLDHADGEPFTILQGVSLWPTEIIRGWTLMATVLLGFRLARAIRQNDGEIALAFGWADRRPLAEDSRISTALRRLQKSLQVTRWGRPGSVTTATSLWMEYMERGGAVARHTRVASATVLFLLVGYMLVALSGPPHVPFRGAVAARVDFWVLWPCVIALVYLNFLVLDATRLCARFVDQLARLESPWSTMMEVTAAQHWGTTDTEARELLRMWLIERRTTAVNRFVLYPALVAGLMLLARSAFFDAWSLSGGLIAIFVLLAGYVIIGALILRRAARTARVASLQRLRDRAWWLRGSDEPDAAQRRTMVETAIERIEALKGGAFAPLAYDPIVGAMLLPSGSLGFIGLVESLYLH